MCPPAVGTACLGLVLTGFSLTALWCPRPFLQNVLRMHVLEAQDLIAKDRFLGGLVKGKSDPYVKLKLAGRSFRTRVVREDLNPRWNEVFEVRRRFLQLGLLPSWYCVLPATSGWPTELWAPWTGGGGSSHLEKNPLIVCTLFSRQVIVTSIPGQELGVEVFDKDLDKDDFLGR